MEHTDPLLHTEADRLCWALEKDQDGRHYVTIHPIIIIIKDTWHTCMCVSHMQVCQVYWY